MLRRQKGMSVLYTKQETRQERGQVERERAIEAGGRKQAGCDRAGRMDGTGGKVVTVTEEE